MRTAVFVSCMYIGDAIRKGDLGIYAAGFYLAAFLILVAMDISEVLAR